MSLRKHSELEKYTDLVDEVRRGNRSDARRKRRRNRRDIDLESEQGDEVIESRDVSGEMKNEDKALSSANAKTGMEELIESDHTGMQGWKTGSAAKRLPVVTESMDVELVNEDSDVDTDDSFEDVNLPDVVIEGNEAGDIHENDSDDSDFENVDLSNTVVTTEEPKAPDHNETLTFTINTKPVITSTPKFTPISKEERAKRHFIHKAFVIMMITHGALRNKYCNDRVLALELRKLVAQDVLDLLRPKDSVLNSVTSRRFLDGLQKLMNMFSKFKVCSEGLVRKDWGELGIIQKNTERNVTIVKFRLLVLAQQGSRDIASQGFVCLLRGLGLDARMVFSLQPPLMHSTKSEDPPKENTTIQSKVTPLKNTSSRNKILQSMRKKPTEQTQHILPTNLPMFWVEVYNKYSQKFVTIHPTLNILEVCPMRRKSKLEIALNSNVLYILAYSKNGAVKDVTRRYTQSYNSKIIKTRLRSDDDLHWYSQILHHINPVRKPSKIDVLEMKEFHDRDLTEGMPNNIIDFKNHPLYVLESQLKQTEVIYDKKAAKCGTFRIRKNNTILPVYKRSAVHSLRSARGWYMRGRVLKMGEQALKVKASKTEEDDTTLYAEYQTQMFVPPPIVDGVIPKNSFGNIDLYTPSMLPEHGYFAAVGDSDIKLLERAARIMEIDFARAITAFDFKNTSRKVTRVPKATEGGIVIAEEFKEAFDLILDNLNEDEAEHSRQIWRLNSMKNWRFFLVKLRIQSRLNRDFGNLDTEKQKVSKSESDLSEYSAHSESDGEGEDDQFSEGGFLLSNKEKDLSHVDTEEGDEEEDNAEVEEDQLTEGGFMLRNMLRDTSQVNDIEVGEADEDDGEDEEDEDDAEDEEDGEDEEDEVLVHPTRTRNLLGNDDYEEDDVDEEPVYPTRTQNLLGNDDYYIPNEEDFSEEACTNEVELGVTNTNRPLTGSPDSFELGEGGFLGDEISGGFLGAEKKPNIAHSEGGFTISESPIGFLAKDFSYEGSINDSSPEIVREIYAVANDDSKTTIALQTEDARKPFESANFLGREGSEILNVASDLGQKISGPQHATFAQHVPRGEQFSKFGSSIEIQAIPLSTPSSESAELPDEFFAVGDKGQLVYDPKPEHEGNGSPFPTKKDIAESQSEDSHHKLSMSQDTHTRIDDPIPSLAPVLAIEDTQPSPALEAAISPEYIQQLDEEEKTFGFEYDSD